MPNVFSQRTLGDFEDASAGIVLRQLVRAFEGAGIGLGEDPGGLVGDRRTRFRRYVASVDQHDAQQLDRLGDALGAMVGEVAASKVEFLVKAAERDGFLFADGVFRPAGSAPISFAVTRVEDLAFLDDRARRLHLLAIDRPSDAIAGAQDLVESVCRTVLRQMDEPDPGKTAALVDIATSTIEALERSPACDDDATTGAAVVRSCLQQLGAVVVGLGELRDDGSSHGRAGTSKGLSPRHARLTVGAAVAFAGFVAETYAERSGRSSVLLRPDVCR